MNEAFILEMLELSAALSHKFRPRAQDTASQEASSSPLLACRAVEDTWQTRIEHLFRLINYVVGLPKAATTPTQK